MNHQKQRHPSCGLNVTATKAIAMRDIHEECGKGKLFTYCYLHNESILLKLTKIDIVED